MTAADRPAPTAEASAPTLWTRFTRGGWYFVVVLMSLGLFSAVPFWHAWHRLRTRTLLVKASAFTAVAIVLVYVLPNEPSRGADPEPTSSGNLSGALAVVMMVVACLLLIGPRREVFGLTRNLPLDADPAIARALEGRARREKARELALEDSQLARELRIGRPDLRRDYDDGGLIDINSAPAEVISTVCDIDPRWSQAIVAARAGRGGVYYHLAELLIDVPLPSHVADRLLDRSICIT